MIKGLILPWKKSRDASLVLLGMAALMYFGGNLLTAAKEAFNPMAFNQALEAKILQAEGRSKELIANEIKNERAISATEHMAVMGAIAAVNERSKRIENKMDTVLEKLPRVNAKLPVAGKALN